MCNEIIINLSSGLIGAIIGAWTVFRVSKIQTFNHAAANFKAELVGTLLKIKNSSPTKDLQTRELLLNALPRLEKAKILFEPYLGKKRRNELNQAWLSFIFNKEKLDACQKANLQKYIDTNRDNISSQYFWDYTSKDGAKEKAVENIEKLLKYTELKDHYPFIDLVKSI